MVTHGDKQHNRIVILTLALIGLSALTFVQQNPNYFVWQDQFEFAPGTTSYTLSIAFFISTLAAVRFMSDSSRELKKSAALAFIDELTEMPNRRQFKLRLQQELSRATRHSHGVCVLYFDLDRFKELNDSYGREIGDKIIIELGKRIQSVFRTEEIVARLGGDEFAAIVTDIDSEHAVETIANRLFKAVSKPFSFGETNLYVNMSVGASLIKNGKHKAEEAIRQADYAVLQAKSAGRNCLKIFDPEMARIITDRLTLETDLRQAIRNDGFHVEYQPFYDAKSKQISGAEALLRWNHPTRGMISPGQFIPIAEKAGYILELGNFVLTQACSDFSKLDKATKIAVNVSPAQFQDVGFVDNLQQVLKKSGLDAERLEIEITEGVFISDPTNAAKIITEIRAMGISVALDDFGTGYSSMSYLQDFKLDRIKIDRSFVEKMDDSIESEKLISAMTSLADSLDLSVTIEGVETPKQLARLEKYNCTEFQGFLFSKSVRLAKFEELYAENGYCDQRASEESELATVRLVSSR